MFIHFVSCANPADLQKVQSVQELKLLKFGSCQQNNREREDARELLLCQISFCPATGQSAITLLHWYIGSCYIVLHCYIDTYYVLLLRATLLLPLLLCRAPLRTSQLQGAQLPDRLFAKGLLALHSAATVPQCYCLLYSATLLFSSRASLIVRFSWGLLFSYSAPTVLCYCLHYSATVLPHCYCSPTVLLRYSLLYCADATELGPVFVKWTALQKLKHCVANC